MLHQNSPCCQRHKEPLSEVARRCRTNDFSSPPTFLAELQRSIFVVSEHRKANITSCPHHSPWLHAGWADRSVTEPTCYQVLGTRRMAEENKRKWGYSSLELVKDISLSLAWKSRSVPLPQHHAIHIRHGICGQNDLLCPNSTLRGLFPKQAPTWNPTAALW